MAARAEQRDAAEAEHALLIALVLVLLAGLAAAELQRRILTIMAAAGLSAGATGAVLGLIGAAGLVFAAPPAVAGPAESFMIRTSATRRARYIVAATRRLERGGSPTAEQALYRAHLASERRRIEAARDIDKAAKKWGPVLGWHSVLDGRTTRECRDSHGANFSALVPPSTGWPGTLHGGNCRCRAVAPWPGGDMLP